MTDINETRRKLLGIAGGGAAYALLGGVLATKYQKVRAQEVPAVRWGFVGTGMISGSMAGVVQTTPLAKLAAVSSRRMSSAETFAKQHSAGKPFDSWSEMAGWEGVDAIYVATPTSVKEEISLAAIEQGKHVLVEKPLSSLESLQRMTAACRYNDVGFMDATHFVHHPRTKAIKSARSEQTGWPWSVASAFQFYMPDRTNIRFNPDLEPMGAIGDAGWYNMRAAVEYLSPEIELQSVKAFLRRDPQSGAVISASGILSFNDGSTSTWNCGFDSGSLIMDLRITGAKGTVSIDNFLGQNPDNSASYTYRHGSFANTATDLIKVPSPLSGAALMFEDFAALVHDKNLRESSMMASERTQALLDAVWEDALKNE